MLGRASRLKTPTACTRACSAGALAGSGSSTEDRDRARLLGVVRRSAGHLHPSGLPAGAVFEQRQRPRYLRERLPDRRTCRTRFTSGTSASLQTSDPLLYQRLAGRATFTSTTIQRHRLLRAFPADERPVLQRPAAGRDQDASLEVILTRRFASGLSGNAAFSMNRVTENRTVEEFDRAPTLWQTNNNGRPWRVTAVGVYELPFGPGRPFLNERGGWPPSLVGGRSAARSNTSRAPCSIGTTSSSTATWTTSRRTTPRSRFDPTGRSIRRRPGSTSTPGSSGYRRSAGGLPEADVPVPRRRRSRVRPVREHERRAHVPSGRHPDVPVAPGRPEPAQPPALCQSGHEPDEHELRAGSGGEQQRHEGSSPSTSRTSSRLLRGSLHASLPQVASC